MKPLLHYIWPIFALVTAGGIGLALWQSHKQGTPEPGTTANPLHLSPVLAAQNRQHLLAKVRSFWIKGVLENSLHGAALMILGLQEQPAAVANPWRFVMQEAERPAHPLPVGTRITDVYDNSDGALLILGKPGAGKTTLLLELARDLLVRAEQDREHPIPIVFHLSSWPEKETSLAHWLVNELHSKYRISRRIGQAWIDTDKILLLLDGLDEVAQKVQLSCIQAINTYRQEHNLVPIVLCSRSAKYFAQTTQVALQTAVEIQPLTAQQVSEYLLSAGEQLEALRFILNTDSVLRELSSTPLMLNIMSLAYRGKDVKDVVIEDSKKESSGESIPLLTAHRQEVFKNYVQQMLHRRESSNRFSSQQIVHWLTWLAKNSSGDISTTLFRYPKYPYFFIFGLMIGAIASTLTILVLWIYSGIVSLNFVGSFIILLCLEMVPSSLMILGGLRYIESNGESSKVGAAKTTTIYSIMFRPGIYMIGASFFPQRWLIILLGIAALLGGGTLLWIPAMSLNLLLRVKLYLSGDVPWDYRSFLDYATEHVLLYKVGDKYIFIHNLLRDYFRSLDATPPKKGHYHRKAD